jgi:hypothetical protein
VLGFLPKERAEIRREVRTDSHTTLSEWRRRFLEDLAEVRQLRYFDPANDPRHGKRSETMYGWFTAPLCRCMATPSIESVRREGYGSGRLRL